MASDLPRYITAVVIADKGTAELAHVHAPELRDDYILVKVTAVGLNPTDWKHVDGHMGWGPAMVNVRLGCDYAGVVVAVGPKVTKKFERGDRVCGVAHGANQVQPQDGTFADYIAVKGDLQIKTPDNLTDEQAATLGIVITTVGQGLYQHIKLPPPKSSKGPTKLEAVAAEADRRETILIYGGSTAVGIAGIQFARASGLRVVTTCSPHNAAYVESLGADAVLDYHSATCAEDIRAAVGGGGGGGGGLRLAWDCVANEQSAAICAAALARGPPAGGRPLVYASLLPVSDDVLAAARPAGAAKVQNGMTLAYTVMGEYFESMGAKFDPLQKDYEFGKSFFEAARALLADGTVKPARVDVNSGGKGLKGVLAGLQLLKENKVSGRKLVYTLGQ